MSPKNEVPAVEVCPEASLSTVVSVAVGPVTKPAGAVVSDPGEPPKGDVRPPRRRRKQVRISDALRREGLDEREVAKKFAGVIERQTPKNKGDANDKLLAEMLMNCFRYLDDRSTAGGAGKAPVPVNLIHGIPRPSRSGKFENRKGKGKKP